MAEEGDSGRVTPLERVFDIIGWFGFLFLLPLTLSVFGFTGPSEWLVQQLGGWGEPLVWMAGFFICQLGRIVFGSGRIIMPLIVGSITAFLIMTAVVEIGFMSWWAQLLKPIGWFYGQALAFAVGILTLIFAYLLSSARRIPGFVLILLLAGIPIAGSFLLHYFNVARLIGLQ
jgi:hypothetical protein